MPLVDVEAVDKPHTIIQVTTTELKEALRGAIARESTIWLKSDRNPWPKRPGARKRHGLVGTRKYKGMVATHHKRYDELKDLGSTAVRSGNSKNKMRGIYPKARGRYYKLICDARAEDGYAYAHRLEKQWRAIKSKRRNPYFGQIEAAYKNDVPRLVPLINNRAKAAVTKKLRRQQKRAADAAAAAG